MRRDEFGMLFSGEVFLCFMGWVHGLDYIWVWV